MATKDDVVQAAKDYVSLGPPARVKSVRELDAWRALNEAVQGLGSDEPQEDQPRGGLVSSKTAGRKPAARKTAKKA